MPISSQVVINGVLSWARNAESKSGNNLCYCVSLENPLIAALQICLSSGNSERLCVYVRVPEFGKCCSNIIHEQSERNVCVAPFVF